MDAGASGCSWRWYWSDQSVAEASHRLWKTVHPKIQNWITGHRKTKSKVHTDGVARWEFPKDTVREIHLVEIGGQYPVKVIVGILKQRARWERGQLEALT